MALIDFQKDNNDLLNFILTERFFKNWKTGPIIVDANGTSEIGGYGTELGLYSSSNLELFLTSRCNQKCEYCYLYKYEDKLYPPEYNKPEIIITNLKKIFDWIIDNDLSIPTVDIFSGEIWHTQFGLDVLNLILLYLDKGLNCHNFMIPTNMSFIHNTDQMCRIQNIIDDAAQKYDTRICFSCSIDGKYCEDGRPRKDGTINDDKFYENLFLFCQHNNYFFHPMISATNVFHWKENYDWWKEKCYEYNFIFRKAVMPIDVRDDNWTEEAIQARLDLEEYIFEDYIKTDCRGNLDELWKHCFPSADRSIECDGHMSPSLGTAYSFPGCTVADTLTVRVGDLAIVPCHRTAYDKFVYGYFDVQDDKIVGITKANNIHMAMKTLLMDHKNTSYECDICPYSDYCLKGCYGAQYDYKKDPFITCKSVCELFKRKIKKRIELYEKYGIIDKIKTLTEFDDEYSRVQLFLKNYNNIKNEVNVYDKMA